MRIRTRFVLAVLLVVATANLAFLAYFVDRGRQEARALLDSHIADANGLLQVVMAGPLYDGNVEQLRSNLDVFFRSPEMLEITLKEYGGDIQLERRREAAANVGERLESRVVILRGIDPLGEIRSVYTTAPIEQRLATSSREILLFSAAMMLGLLAVIYLVARGLTRPIDRLVLAARAMADGQIDQRIDVDSVGELSILGESFVRMRDAIREKIADLADNNRLLAEQIAQRREAEQERDRLVSVLESTTDFVSIGDLAGHLLYLNRAGRMLSGKGDAPVAELEIPGFHPEWAATKILVEGIPTARRDGIWSGETALLGTHGQEIPVSQVIIGHKDAAGNLLYLSTIMRDITAERQAQEALRLSEQRLQQATRVANIGIFDHDHLTDTIYWSAEQRQIYGFGPDEPVTLEAYLACVFPEDMERIWVAVQRAHDPAGDGLFDIEHRIIRRDGQVRFVTTRSYTFFNGNGGAERHKVRTIGAVLDITERKRIEDELQLLNATLEARVQARTAELAQRNDELAIAKSHAEAVNRDLEAALANLRQAQDELVRTEKMASLGSLVAGLAHELNTPIGNAVMVASTLSGRQREFEAGIVGGLRRSALEGYLAGAREGTEVLERNLQRAAELIGSFKQLAVDQSSYQRRPFDLAELVQEIALALSPTLRRAGVALVDETPAGVRLDSYPGPLGQVLINLINNAVVHAFDGGASGTVRIVTQRPAPDRVCLVISDDGHGIASEHLKLIFDPFFTTKFGRGGSGLGLHIVYSLVTGLLGGRIDVRSTPGKGTEFRVELPLVAPAAPLDADNAG